MISRFTLFSMVVFSALSYGSCTRSTAPTGSGNTMVQAAGGATTVPSPPCIVYKTKSDFYHNVPVNLSEDKSQVISYPDVKDVFYKGELAYPSRLSNGYFLDNRGIGPNVAFLKYTYTEYSKLERTPTAIELFNNLLDKDPVSEMYDCGSRSSFTDPVKELNALIKSGALQDSKRLK